MIHIKDMKHVWFGLLREIIIYEYEMGLLYEDGRFIKALKAGKYRYPYNKNISINRITTRQMSEVISGQEILTQDRIGVRVSLIAKYIVSDPVLAVNSVESYTEQLYQDLQIALRDTVTGRDVDTLLSARSELGEELLNAVAPQASEYGVTLKRVGIRDIVLPGQVRNVFMKEIEADREGRAEMVKARHELAAARSRANTAKILTENPAILRMREMDALLALAGKHGNVIMLPNLADLLIRRDMPQTSSAPTASEGKKSNGES